MHAARMIWWWLRRTASPALFSIRIEGGTARLAKGQAPAAWVAACAEVGRDFGIERGVVDGARSVRGVVLRFSPGVPAASHQRLRNLFAVYRRGR